MAESGGTQVECNSNGIGLYVSDMLHIDIHKAENCIGEYTFFIGKHLYTVESTVDDAVSVDSEKFHGFLLKIIVIFYYITSRLK